MLIFSMVLHLQNFDIIRIFIPQRHQIRQKTSQDSLDCFLILIGHGKGQRGAGLRFIVPNFCSDTAHICDGAFCHGNGCTNGSAENITACFRIAAVAGDTETADPVILS